MPDAIVAVRALSDAVTRDKGGWNAFVFACTAARRKIVATPTISIYPFIEFHFCSIVRSLAVRYLSFSVFFPGKWSIALAGFGRWSSVTIGCRRATTISFNYGLRVVQRVFTFVKIAIYENAGSWTKGCARVLREGGWKARGARNWWARWQSVGELSARTRTAKRSDGMSGANAITSEIRSCS